MTLENIPFYMHWMSYVAYTRYGFEGTMLAIYGYDRDTLTCSQVCSPTKTQNFYHLEVFHSGRVDRVFSSNALGSILLRLLKYGFLTLLMAPQSLGVPLTL